MAKDQKCRVSNCQNIIKYKGNVCGTHRWRMAKFNSYDLPTYKGEPNYYVEDDPLPEGIVTICEKHGMLTEENVYNRYYKNKISTRYCRECCLEKQRSRKLEGLTQIETYEILLQKQNNVCAICKEENTATRQGRSKKMAIDHCHKTLKVRGLLCSQCNSALGLFDDSIEILESAIKYLKNSIDAD
jgi:hypothetical protein